MLLNGPPPPLFSRFFDLGDNKSDSLETFTIDRGPTISEYVFLEKLPTTRLHGFLAKTLAFRRPLSCYWTRFRKSFDWTEIFTADTYRYISEVIFTALCKILLRFFSTLRNISMTPPVMCPIVLHGKRKGNQSIRWRRCVADNSVSRNTLDTLNDSERRILVWSDCNYIVIIFCMR